MSRTREPSRDSVPAGGPSAINGLVYQMLWSLLRASRLRVQRPVVTPATGEITEIILVLEPIEGGGDLVLRAGQERTVEQLKARSGGGTWSLREIVEDVLPDLYVAVPDAASPATFRFVTGGRMGRWMEAYKFFRSLRDRVCGEHAPLSALDNDHVVFDCQGGASPTEEKALGSFWERETYTERQLFERIVAEVRKPGKIAASEAPAATQGKVWALLANFEFVGEQYMDQIQKEVDAILLAVVDRNDDLPTIRDAMAFDLARRATRGDAEIEAKAFFCDHGVNATPLTDWSQLRSNSRRLVERFLGLRGYDRGLDVRFDACAEVVKSWEIAKPMLAISGESGQGKSWRAYAVALHLLPQQELVVAIDASGNAREKLDEAASVVWAEIAGHDTPISLSRIATRVRSVLGGRPGRWLTLIIDGVQTEEEAQDLARQPWEKWGIRAVFTAHPRIAEAMERASLGRCTVTPVGDFTLDELHRYLALCLGDNWPQIPNYMRNPLRRPLLASLYRETVTAAEWRPTSEYEVYAAYSKRLLERSLLGGSRLRHLARGARQGAHYPWSDRQLHEAGLDEPTIKCLDRAGWLRMVESAGRLCYEVPHHRLLNWLVAESLVEDLRDGSITLEEFANVVHECLAGKQHVSGRGLGFVPMDAVWLVLKDDQLSQQVPSLLPLLETDFGQQDSLYGELLPTLGPPIAPALLARLADVFADSVFSRKILEAIAELNAPDVGAQARQWLDGDRPPLQRAAMQILTRYPSAEALDRLWELHVGASVDPAPYLREHEHRYSLYEDNFGALREGCRLDPAWLERAITQAVAENEPVSDLAYLLGNLTADQGREIWHRCKSALFAKVRPDKQRSLADCIRRFRDASEVEWLLAQVPREEDLVGAAAMSALARVGPESAVEALHALPRESLYFARTWFADALFAACKQQMQAKILQMMRDAEDPWKVAAVYSDRQHHVDAAGLDLLLDDLEERLQRLLSAPDPPSEEATYRPLSLLAGVRMAGLLPTFAARRGSLLESRVAEFLLRIGPRGSLCRDSLVRDPALDVLLRIGGTGFTQVINEFLRAPSRYGRLDAIELAAKAADRETVRLLAGIAESEEMWDGHPLEQAKAAAVLAEIGEWEPVIRYLERFALEATRAVTDYARHGLRPPRGALEQARSHVRDRGTRSTAGCVKALGFGDCEQDAPLVRGVLADCDPESDLAHACVIALEVLGDRSEESVPLLARQLNVKRHEFSAKNALIVNGTQAALLALAAHVRGRFDAVVLINLLNRLESPREALHSARNAFAEGDKWFPLSNSWADLDMVIAHVHDTQALQELLDDVRLKEEIRENAFEDEGASWFTGSKAAAIRCLARFDESAALLAAKTALRNPKWHDREHYPYILVELDAQTAASLLLKHVVDEEEEHVVRAIGRAMLNADADDLLLEGMKSKEADERRAACVVAGYGSRGPAIEERLQECLADEDDKVARAATSALDCLHRRREAVRLAEALIAEQDASRRWLLLDCLLETADPGDAHRPWPTEGPPVGDVLSPLQLSRVRSRLEGLRREAQNRRRK